MLIVLAGVPIEAAFCAFRCAASTRALVVHHGDGQTCDEAAPEYADSQLSVVPTHDCSSHSLIRQPITTIAERADILGKPVISVIATIDLAIRFPEDGRSTFVFASPPGTAPPTTPVVLRI